MTINNFSRFNDSSNIELGPICLGYDVFSFDVFETLIRREGVFRPSDIFTHISKRAISQIGARWSLDDETFVRLRQSAEREARAVLGEHRGRQEVRIEDIYARLSSLLPTLGRPPLSPEILKQLIQLEYDVELEWLRPIPEMHDFYVQALAAGKKVVFVSDFYAPSAFVQEALTRCGYKVEDNLFVSSDIDLTKHHGDLYSYVCNEIEVSARQVLHFGDNSWSDGSRAMQKGVAHWSIANPVRNFSQFHRLSGSALTPADSFVRAVQADRLFGTGLNARRPEDVHLFERVGVEVLGPLLLGMSGWLYQEARNKGYDILHFCSRDGRVMQKAFNFWQKRFGEVCQTRYLQISRQVIYRARAVTDTNMARQLFIQNWYNLSPREALSRWGVDPENFSLEIRDCGFSSADDLINVGDQEGAKRLSRLFDILQTTLQKANLAHRDVFCAYLDQELLAQDGQGVIVDIGWHGSLQTGLAHVLQNRDCGAGEIPAQERQRCIKIAGRYLGLFLKPGQPEEMDAHGYLFSIDGGPVAKALRRSPSLVELLHTAGHGSTQGYLKSLDKIIPQYEARSSESRQYVDLISPIQEAALVFVSNVLDSSRFSNNPVSPMCAFSGLDRLLNRPLEDEIRILGGLKIASNYGALATETALTELSPTGYRLWNV